MSMRKVELRMKELKKYELIKKLVETNGNKRKVAIKLNCSIRTVNRLVQKYKKEGKAGFIHGNRGRKPITTMSSNEKKLIIDLYKNEFEDANFKHFSEILFTHYGINVSDTTVNRILREEYILSPKSRRKTRIRIKRELKELQKEASTKKAQNELVKKAERIDAYDSHPRRSRCAYFGEMIQMDASSYIWFNNVTTHLHVAIDDATGKIVGAYFDEQETLNGYYNVFYQILNDYGIPAMFFTDKRTVFEYNKKNASNDEADTYTQFSYACHQLGVDIKTSSVPQAKGRVERLNQTLQSRLPIELRIAGIKNIDQANHFLKEYIKQFNEQFSLQLHASKTVFEKQPTDTKINTTLAILAQRKVDSGHSIKYKNKYYIPHTKNGSPVYFKRGTDVLVIEAFDKSLFVTVQDEIFTLDIIPVHYKHSKEFDNVEVNKTKKKWIPPMDHPWRQYNFINHVQKQKHRQNDGANV